ncbi:hypothetical protein EPN44_09240 [bacterium]|nr:MAG: hypothetical protein EPN44_09240 [bacterium]
MRDENEFVTRAEFAESFEALHGFIEIGFSRLSTDLVDVRAELAQVKDHVAHIDRRLAQVDRRLARVDDRVSVLENDMSRVKAHLGIAG